MILKLVGLTFLFFAGAAISLSVDYSTGAASLQFRRRAAFACDGDLVMSLPLVSSEMEDVALQVLRESGFLFHESSGDRLIVREMLQMALACLPTYSENSPGLSSAPEGHKMEKTYAATTATTTAPSSSLEDLEKVVQALNALGPEPIGEWMRARGFPPESSRLFLPEAIKKEIPAPLFWPTYVTFTNLVTCPVLCNNLDFWPDGKQIP